MPGAIASLTLLASLLLGILVPGVSWGGAKAEQSKEDLNRLHERIEALKKELDSTKEAHKDATDELKASEKAISETNRKLYELSKQHKQNRNALAGLQQQKLEIETTVKEQQDLLGAQLYQRYLHGQQGYIQIVLQQQDPGAIARQLHYYSYVSALIASMQQNLGKIARLNDETANALKALTELKQKQEQERRELQAQKNERNKVLKQLSAKISSQRGEISKLKRDEKRLSQLVERLSRIIPKTVPKKRSKAAKSSEPVGRNEELPTNAFDGGNFAALKGKLNLPIRGDIANRFGDSREDTGVSWKGLFIKSSEGSEVKSIASGRVVFADWLRGFGNLLIVDHGDGYMSLYGNNQSLLKRVGETVSGGDTIAAVGNSGGNETSGLYFELRHRSKPLDPLGWSRVR
jgi:septal ring factor EnvC (AmiA/AmiB activator)